MERTGRCSVNLWTSRSKASMKARAMSTWIIQHWKSERCYCKFKKWGRDEPLSQQPDNPFQWLIEYHPIFSHFHHHRPPRTPYLSRSWPRVRQFPPTARFLRGWLRGCSPRNNLNNNLQSYCSLKQIGEFLINCFV